MLPLIPLAVGAYDVAVGLAGVGLSAKYIYDSLGTPRRTPANNIPSTSDKLKNLGSRTRPAPLTDNTKNIIAKKKNLAGLASGISAGLALGAGAIGLAVTDSIQEVSTASDATKIANDATKSQFPDSHFLKNQVDSKQSVDNLVDAMHAQTIAMFQAISPISLHLASLVTAVNASTDAILGLDPSVSVASPTVNVPEAPPPTVNVGAPVIDFDVSPIVEQMKQSDNSFRQTYLPSGEFWAKADSATVKYNRSVGTSQTFDYLPSASNLVSEVTMIADMVERGANQSQIIKSIESFRKNSLSSAVYALTMYSDDVFNSQDDLNKSMKNYYDHALDTNVPASTVSMAESLGTVAAWASHARENEIFKKTPIPFKDSDGDLLFDGSPLEVEAHKNAQLHKKTDDINTQRHDDEDFNTSFNSIPLVPFIPRADIFNPAHETPTSNVFLDRIKSMFPGIF